jgi:uncharacterized protein YqjF (DUF2071 family)
MVVDMLSEQVPIAAPCLRMAWHRLVFAHWRVTPAAVQRLLPAGLTVETFDGIAWVGLVPFRMQAIQPLGLPAPWFGPDFLELNVRTYVRGPGAQTGVWFFTLECNHRPAVAAARAGFALAYRHAPMSDAQRGRWWGLQARRRGAACHMWAQRTSPWRLASEDACTNFLFERYRLFAFRSQPRQLLLGQVRHAPYQIADARVHVHARALLAERGFACIGNRPPDHVAVARPVEVVAGPPRILRW